MDEPTTIADRVRLIVAGHMGRPKAAVHLADQLFADIGIDWFDLEELIVFLSEAFGGRTVEASANEFRVVGDLVKFAQSVSAQDGDLA